MRQAFEMPATIDAVDPTVVSLKAVAADYLSDSGLTGFEVAVSEALANVVTHAFEASSGSPVAIEFVSRADGVTIVISDAGRPAPSDLFANVAELATIDVLAEDGRGLSLIDHFADEVSYRSENGTNRLTLVFARDGRA